MSDYKKTPLPVCVGMHMFSNIQEMIHVLELIRGLTLVIQTFYPFATSVLYSRDVDPTSSIVRCTTFPFIVLKSHYVI